MFRQARNRCIRVLEAATLAYANKTKESVKLGSQDFWRIANSVLNKGKSAIPPIFNSPEEFCVRKTFRKTRIFMTRVFRYLFSLLELI